MGNTCGCFDPAEKDGEVGDYELNFPTIRDSRQSLRVIYQYVI